MDLRRFIIKCFLMAAPVLLLIVLLEWRLAQVPNSHTLKKEYLEAHLLDTEVLVLGSSHALYAVNPSELSNVSVNLSNVSQTPWYDAALLEKYIARLPKLKVVCVSVSYDSFFADLSSTSEYWRDYFYEHFWGLYSPTARPDFLRRNFLFYLYGPGNTPKLLAGKGLLGEMASGVIRPDGWLPGDTTAWRSHISEESGRARVLSQQTEQDSLGAIRQWAALSHLLQLSQKHGVKVILFTTPLCDTFRRHMDERLWANVQQRLFQLCDQGLNCQYWDFSNAERLGLTPIFFFDNDHLNAKGAKVFSQMLDSIIIGL